jgi:hypothetical protein
LKRIRLRNTWSRKMTVMVCLLLFVLFFVLPRLIERGDTDRGTPRHARAVVTR